MVPDSEKELEVYDNGELLIYFTRAGLWEAKDKEGKALVCGLDKESVILWGREHLNGFQNSYTSYPDKTSNYKL